MRLRALLAAALVAAASFASLPSQASGLFPGFPAASTPLTGNETIPADTNLTGGQTATELVTAGQIADYGVSLVSTNVYSSIPIGSVAYGSLGTNTTPVAGTIYWTNINIPTTFSVGHIACMNGGTAATDKLLYGLYNSSGTLVANTATAGTVASGTDAFQSLATTATYSAAPGHYWIGWQTNGTTTRFRTVATATYITVLSASATGAFGTLTALTVPTSFTADKAPICYVAS